MSKEQDPLRKHVSDAAIAAQLEPPTDAEWLAKADKVRQAKERLLSTDLKLKNPLRNLSR